MKKNMLSVVFISILSLLLLLLLLSNTTSFAQYITDSTITGNINYTYGQEIMNHKDWHPVDCLNEGQLSFDIRDKSWPISIYIAYSEASGKKNSIIQGYDTKLGLNTKEIDCGVKKIIDDETSNFHLYLAGGLSTIIAEAKMSISYMGDSISMNRMDNNPGLWASTGLYYTIADIVNLGIGVKYSTARVDFDGSEKLEIGGFHYGVLVGYHF